MNRTITRWGASAAISAAMLVGLAGAGQAQTTNWLKKYKDPNKQERVRRFRRRRLERLKF